MPQIWVWQPPTLFLEHFLPWFFENLMRGHLLTSYEKVKVDLGKVNALIDWRPKVKFASVWSNNFGKLQHTMVMEQTLMGAKILKRNNVIKSKKCNQCEYASSYKGNLRQHLKIHSGEKSNKCNQCDYASSLAGNLRKHLKMHSGEKSNKCNQCDFASSQAGDLRRHLATHSGEKTNKCNQCTMCQAIELRS